LFETFGAYPFATVSGSEKVRSNHIIFVEISILELDVFVQDVLDSLYFGNMFEPKGVT
jgi:hypothetical protein